MDENDAQIVLRCPQCNKPFDKQSSLKRHGYYCRSRKAGSTPRSRSCTACVKAKARCDNKRRGCSRCINKAIECHYPTNARRDTGRSREGNEDAPVKRRKMASPVVADSFIIENLPEVSNLGDMIPDDPFVPGAELPDLGGDFLDWNDAGINFTDFMPTQENEATFPYPSPPDSSSITHRSTPSPDQTFIYSMLIPSFPSFDHRSLIQRPKLTSGPQRTASLILHTLKSYPLMMMRDKTLPPFIHPRVLSSDFDASDMEPLTNCISLMHMIGTGVQQSRKLFWKNVRMECERICAEVQDLNKWGMMAAMQAVSIYILMRLSEGETEHNNFDYLMLSTVIALSQRYATTDFISDAKPSESWKDWIFAESQRRICIVYRVINMLVYFEPATMCNMDHELVLAPLPARKQLWEASNEAVWKAESERDPEIQSKTVFGLVSTGDLVKLDADKIFCSNAVALHHSSDARTEISSVADWGEWCSGMDSFGGLVMLAASLVG